ncbi:MAG: molybdopterin-dependent oxidoreductase [Chloroflexota bacterium]|nr:molybdopterin-dependent oxidoreductase [Chloroflexota bacterium]
MSRISEDARLSAWPADVQQHRAPSFVSALAGGIAATTAAGAVMLLLRWTLQVRSAPERVLEWLLLFVPLDVFEAMLQRFGFSAKRYALIVGIAVMLALLVLLGQLALKRRWPPPALLGLGLGLWLFTMLVIMPLTSAGYFAVGLVEGSRNAILGYLAIGMVYSAVLCLWQAFVLRSDVRAAETVRLPGVSAGPTIPPRRWALGVMASSVAAVGVTYLLGMLMPHRSGLPTIVVADPQEPVPSGGLEEPNPHPNVVATPAPAAAQAPPPPAPAASARSALPQPSTSRVLKRDQDGVVLPSGRRPGELPEPITPVEDFYIVTKNAGGDPVVQPEDWRLVVDGEVERAFELDYATLRKLPTVEITKTLECISNLVTECQLAPFGCDLISTARWKGVRVADILNLVGGVKAGAAFLATISADEYTTALPLALAMSPDAVLVYEMNGQVLPREHGYPARLLVPGRYGMKNPKWVVALRPMRREFIDWYGQRNWSREGIVKTMTRIDVPGGGARLSAGEHRIAGIAYAGDRGVQMVEFSADGGDTWAVADLLEPPPGPDVWVRWQASVRLPPGARTTLMARATDGLGALQPEAFSLAQPDGAAGWHSIAVETG